MLILFSPGQIMSALSLEVDIGEDLGEALSPKDAARQLRSIASPVSIAEWAGEVLPASELVKTALIGSARLDDWVSRVQVISFEDERGVKVYPVEQFKDGEPLVGLDEIMALIGDPRVAWLWLRNPHVLLDRHSPLEILRAGMMETLRPVIARDFH